MTDFTLKSRLKDLYRHPVGHDVIDKIMLQAGIPRRLIQNPMVMSLSLSLLRKLAGKRLGDGFFEALLALLNQSPDTLAAADTSTAPEPSSTATVPSMAVADTLTASSAPSTISFDAPSTAAEDDWWKTAVFYQIYPRSFMDGNNDGIGDLAGIIAKLDYLKELGIDAVWLSPIYDSPGDDNGYDIRDYHQIDPQFGTMADFDAMLHAIHSRGMRLVMDLVVNHTSDEHPWFREALGSPDTARRDYYFLRPEPNNWTSFFSGTAWNEYPEAGLWGLHLFSQKQMDLNWDHPQMRQDLYAMIRWWLEKGVDGFRLDVINYISKKDSRQNGSGLPNGQSFIGELMGFTGIEHYFYGPRLHEYLKEMQREAFAPFKAFSVGETPGIGMEMGKLLTDRRRGELDMIFSFDHLETAGHARFDIYEYDLNYYKAYIINWMEHYANTSWMSLFYDNHDNPRMVSKVDHTHRHRQELATMLAMIQMTLKGTPFLFQGQELGMINQDFKDIKAFRDVESLNKYQELCEKMAPAEAFRHILAGSRDHARTPMPWSAAPGGGFTQAVPWIDSDGDEKICNAADQSARTDSCLAFYRRLIALRRKTPALRHGDITFSFKKKRDFFTYTRHYKNETYLMVFNLGTSADKLPNRIFSCFTPNEGPENTRRHTVKNGGLILSNYADTLPASRYLQAYEGRIYRITP